MILHIIIIIENEEYFKVSKCRRIKAFFYYLQFSFPNQVFFKQNKINELWTESFKSQCRNNTNLALWKSSIKHLGFLNKILSLNIDPSVPSCKTNDNNYLPTGWRLYFVSEENSYYGYKVCSLLFT